LYYYMDLALDKLPGVPYHSGIRIWVNMKSFRTTTYNFAFPQGIADSHSSYVSEGLLSVAELFQVPRFRDRGIFIFITGIPSTVHLPAWSQCPVNELDSAHSSGIQKSVTCRTLLHHKVPATFTNPYERRQREICTLFSLVTSDLVSPCAAGIGSGSVMIVRA
jgi:hypothetical protein